MIVITRSASCKGPYIDLNKHLEVETLNDVIKIFDFIKNEEEQCMYKKVNRSTVTFFVLYVDDILLI